MGYVFFQVWSGLFAVKDIVRTDIEQWCRTLVACRRYVARTFRVRQECEVSPGFAFVHAGEGGGVNHYVGRLTDNGRFDRARIGDVHFGTMNRNDLVAPFKIRHQVAPQHTRSEERRVGKECRSRWWAREVK